MNYEQKYKQLNYSVMRECLKTAKKLAKEVGIKNEENIVKIGLSLFINNMRFIDRFMLQKILMEVDEE